MKRLSDTARDEMFRLRQNNVSVRQIANSFGLTYSTTFRFLKKHGIEGDCRGGCRLPVYDVAEKYLKGASMRDLAREYQCGFPMIGKALRKANTAKRPQGKVPNPLFWIVRGGYIAVKPSPGFESMARADGLVLQHRLVMAQSLGRPLYDWETVTHKDGQKNHNELSNLQLLLKPHGMGVAYRCKHCGSDELVAVEKK